MFEITQIMDKYFIGPTHVSFRNRSVLIQKINNRLCELYGNSGEMISADKNIVKKSYAYNIYFEDDIITDCNGRTRNYKKYSLITNCVAFNSEEEATSYLEGMLSEIVLLLSDEPDDIELDDDILDIISE